MHCANEADRVDPVVPSVAKMTHTLSAARAATPNHAFEGALAGVAPLRSADAAPQRKHWTD